MEGAEDDPVRLEEDWSDALAEYSTEVKRTLDLLSLSGQPTPGRREAIRRQQAAEQRALEKYQNARRAYLGFLKRVAGLALILALQMR